MVMKVTEGQIRKRNQLFDEKNEDRRYCWGCGKHDHLSRAHIVRYSSIPFEGAKISLQMDIDNLAYLCMNNPEGKGCHTIWDDNSWNDEKEFWEIHNLKCFVEFMQVIKDKDPMLYQKRLDQINYWIKYYGNSSCNM
jgi:hypothetical protein